MDRHLDKDLDYHMYIICNERPSTPLTDMYLKVLMYVQLRPAQVFIVQSHAERRVAPLPGRKGSIHA